jgi:hypothetical protein
MCIKTSFQFDYKSFKLRTNTDHVFLALISFFEQPCLIITIGYDFCRRLLAHVEIVSWEIYILLVRLKPNVSNQCMKVALTLFGEKGDHKKPRSSGVSGDVSSLYISYCLELIPFHFYSAWLKFNNLL